MPRNSRIDIPGLLQHVIVRGIDGQTIFLDDQDKEQFIARFSFLLQETSTECYAWALLDNHFHLLLRPTTSKLSNFMRRLLTGYAVVFNLRHNRSGHLFQNRYKSIVCDEEPYLLELIRYIHLNPIRAYMVKDLNALAEYPWCGHTELMGETYRHLIKKEEILPLFSITREKAVHKYHCYIADGLQNEPTTPLSGGGKAVSRAYNPALADDSVYDSRILGGGDFTLNILNSVHLPTEHSNLSFADVLKLVATYFEVTTDELSEPNKKLKIVKAKSVICYIAIRCLKLRGVDIAPRLGYSPAAVSHAANKGKQVLDNESELKKILLEP